MTRSNVLAAAAALAALTGHGPPRAPADPVTVRTVLLGRSVDGRRIAAVEIGDRDSPRKVLVVGCIHGDECAGLAVAARLARSAAPSETDLWVVGGANPDGAANRTRGNAHGVDLNRNFPWRWSRLTGAYDSGPRPLSEPETRAAARLIVRVRPSLSIWFHQHLDLVDDSSGNRAIEQRFARAAGLRLAPLAREPGSAVTWESHCLPRASSFVVELPSGTLARGRLARIAGAVRLAAAAAPESRPPPSRCRARS